MCICVCVYVYVYVCMCIYVYIYIIIMLSWRGVQTKSPATAGAALAHFKILQDILNINKYKNYGDCAAMAIVVPCSLRDHK